MNISMMAPNNHFILNTLPVEPVSRTYQYRKIMKPMLERKRRARINKCLDELKDLMTGTLQEDGENVSKLEKADILELTVRHLHRLREHNALFLGRVNWMNSSNNNYNRSGNDNGYNYCNNNSYNTINIEKFWAGFQHCIAEVSQFLRKYDHSISNELIKHIENYIPNLMTATMAAAAVTAVNAATVITNATTATSLTPVKGITHEITSPINRSLAVKTSSSTPAAAVGPVINHLMIANTSSSSSLTATTTIDYQRHMAARRTAAPNRVDFDKRGETRAGAVAPMRIRFHHGENYSRIETKPYNRQRHEMLNAVWRPW